MFLDANLLFWPGGIYDTPAYFRTPQYREDHCPILQIYRELQPTMHVFKCGVMAVKCMHAALCIYERLHDEMSSAQRHSLLLFGAKCESVAQQNVKPFT